jgi:hypothetical protein
MNRPPLPDRRRVPGFRDRGLTAPGCLFLLILLAILGIVGYRVGEAYWSYYQVKEKVREVLTWAVAGGEKPEMDITRRVISGASEVGVSLKSRNVQIVQDARNLTIIASWNHELEFPFYSFPFGLQVKLTDVKRWGRGGLVIK